MSGRSENNDSSTMVTIETLVKVNKVSKRFIGKTWASRRIKDFMDHLQFGHRGRRIGSLEKGQNL